MTSTLCNSKSLLAVFLIAVLLPLALAQEIESATESSAAAPADGPFDFTGRFRLYSSKNFDEFLKELGIGYFQRLAANNAVPEYFITKKGDYYTLRAITPLSDNSITFKDGEEFKEDRLDGVRLRSIITIDGHKWTQIQYGKPEVTIVREWVGNDIITTSTANNVVSVRKYRRVRSAPAKPRTAIGRAASRAAGRT